MWTRRDFRAARRKRPQNDEWYDLEHDARLIEQSIAKQYGLLPAAQEELPWAEWSVLVGGLMDDTPLGRVVAVRSERDVGVIRRMTVHQRQLRSEWQRFCARREMARDPEGIRQRQAALERSMALAFGSFS